MRSEKREKLALSAFGREYNCAQSVVMGFPEVTGGREETVLKLAAGFGGGMGRLQEACGALTGGFMVIGLLTASEYPDKEIKEEVYRRVQELAIRFREEFGTINCRDLLGVDLNTPEGEELNHSLGLREKVCEKCVARAVSLTQTLMKEQLQKGDDM
jgi:C_GCAxxG_C_C family probable redox protein